MTAPQFPLAAERTVACPACRGPSLYSARNPSRPFCCPRCKNADLGAWASEEFRVAAREPADDAAPGA
ncbi:MAG: DNA gyrase inhibitor YacG [Burkholderiales bacterium]